jgi:cytochrome c peroxidase
MRYGARLPVLALCALVALSACQDAPTFPDDPQFNRGQTKKNDPPPSPANLADLGELLFDDEKLSVRGNQSCRSCHEPEEGFAAHVSPVRDRGGVVEGSVSGRFGDRKPPTAAYATFTPAFSGGNNPTGGLFWDGRATGAVLGSAAADQALGPFLNHVEHGFPDEACVVYRIRGGTYLSAWTDAWGGDITAIAFPGDTETVCTDVSLAVGRHVVLSAADRTRVETIYSQVARSIAAYEGSDRVNRFNSRFDLGLMNEDEQAGEKLFSSKGKCQQCHDNRGSRPLFTDFAFHNLGVPKNPANPVYHLDTPDFDPGLGGFTLQARHIGKFRTPTTRNVAKGMHRRYMHNGALISLVQVVDFYNTRDVLPVCTDGGILQDPWRWGSSGMPGYDGADCWPPPEYDRNLDTKNMGKLGLTQAEVLQIVAYLEAMSDGDAPPM